MALLRTLLAAIVTLNLNASFLPEGLLFNAGWPDLTGLFSDGGASTFGEGTTPVGSTRYRPDRCDQSVLRFVGAP